MTTDQFNAADTSRIIEMAWEDRTPFEAIAASYGLSAAQIIRFMRQNLKRNTFKIWRARVTGRTTKHQLKRPAEVSRGYCPTQYKPR